MLIRGLFVAFCFNLIFHSNRCDAVESSLTVQSAIDEARTHNPEMRAFEAAVAGARGGVRSAQVYANPELSVAPGVKRLSEPGGSQKEFHGNLELSQLFQFPGKRALKIAIAEKNVAVRQIALEGFRFALAARVRRAFYDLLAAQKIVALRADHVDSAKTCVESSKKRAESGYASDFEPIKSQAELIAAQRGLLDSRGRVAAARVTLNTLLGRLPATALALTGTIESAAVRPGSPSELVALAMAHNPALRTLAVQAEAAGLTLRSMRLGNRPDFAVGPQVEYTKDEQIYGLGVTVALPFWDLKKGEIQTATAEQTKVLAELEKLRAEVRSEVAKSAEALRIASSQLALYSPEFLEKLKAFVQQAEQGYAQNATTLIIYLDAKRTYVGTLTDYYEALSQVAENRADLESAVGVPLELKP